MIPLGLGMMMTGAWLRVILALRLHRGARDLIGTIPKRWGWSALPRALSRPGLLLLRSRSGMYGIPNR